jgi:hypothetical protein
VPRATGTETVIGKAKFYTGTLPGDFIYCNPDTLANTRRSTTTMPAWWDGTGTDHNITVMWDCTNGGNVNNVQTVPAGNCP